MTAERSLRATLLILLSIVAVLELYPSYLGVLALWELAFPLFLLVLALAGVVLRPEHPAMFPLTLLLVSVSALKTGISPPEFESWLGTTGRLTWSGLQLLFPFAFVHLSLVFPVPFRWVARRKLARALIYGPCLAMLLLLAFAEPVESYYVLVFPVGFLFGLGVFVRQYLVVLTSSERNRLRLVLIGCFAGFVPWFMMRLGTNYIPVSGAYLGDVLLTLFPVCLVAAVLKENLVEVSQVFQRMLVYCLVLSGVLAGFFVTWLGLSAAMAADWSSTARLFVSSAIPLALAYPLSRWASRYVSSRFFASADSDSADPRPSHPFVTIRPNPFIVGNPIRRPEMFFGREEEFRFIQQTLVQRASGTIILLIGERRTGKSSILYQIMNGRLGDGFVPVFFDLQSAVVESDLEFLDALAAKIRESAGEQPAADRPGVASQKTPHLVFGDFLDRVIQQIGDRELLLLLDEYDLIDQKVASGKLSPELPAFLNSLLERHPRLSLILTGSRSLGEKTVWNPLVTKAQYREISFLARSDAERLIRKPLEERAEFQRGSVGRMLRLSRGHPFFTQLLGQLLVEILNEKQNGWVDPSVIDEVVTRLKENPPPQLLYQWAGLELDERLVLSSLASVLTDSESYASYSKVDHVLSTLPPKQAGNWTTDKVRMVLEGLRRQRILDRDQTRYRFTMDLLRHWIQFDHSVWDVLNESRTS